MQKIKKSLLYALILSSSTPVLAMFPPNFISATNKPELTVTVQSGSSLKSCKEGMAPCPLIIPNQGSGNLTITNNSTSIVATNIIVQNLETTWPDVTQDASACVSVPINGGQCMIIINSPTVNGHVQQTFTVQGDNTIGVSVDIAVAFP